MIGIKFTSAWVNPSGYGSSARTGITALFTSGINLTIETVSQMPESTNYGLTGGICKSLENRKIPYKIKIVELTPDLLPMYKEPNVYTISRLFWETDHLPKEWITPLNEIDEIWTASPQMGEMIHKSGVTTPCYYFPQPIWTDRADEAIEPYSLPFPKDFTFYSIFQWIDRKNPKGLLRAYWKAFEGNDKVSLLLKTYRITYTDTEFDLIKSDIEMWKKELGLNHYPKIYLARKLLTDAQMLRLHKLGDCYVNASSGEGWSRPMQEAMLLGKPVISGNNGGITDIMTPIHYYEVPSSLQEATEVSQIPWYRSDQHWLVLKEEALTETLKEVYANYDKACQTGRKAQQFVVDNFGFLRVGTLMRTRLEQIYKTL